MKIECRSFGFKNGADAQGDFVFDVRCLPNPFYIEHLKHKTGLDKSVREYVLNDTSAKEYLQKIIDMILLVISIKEKNGVDSLKISFGCTGGHHRSVTIAEALCKRLKENKHNALSTHRDIQKGV